MRMIPQGEESIDFCAVLARYTLHAARSCYDPSCNDDTSLITTTLNGVGRTTPLANFIVRCCM